MTQPAANFQVHAQPDTIPNGWTEIPVQRLIEKHFCGPSPDCQERQIQSEQEWGVLKTTAITWDGWNEAAHKTLPRRFWGLQHLQVQYGDVLITKAGPRDRVAVVAHVTTNPKRLIVSGKMIALRPRPDAVVPQVLAGVLGLRKTQDFIHGRTTGMAESQVNFANTVVLETNVRVPSKMREQFRIAEILDTLNAAIREAEALVAKLKQVKAGLLHDLLTRGLDEHGQLRDPARHPEQFQDSPLGRIPKPWRVLKLEQLYAAPSRNGLYKGKKAYGRGNLMVHMPQMFRGFELGTSDCVRVRLSPSELRDYHLEEGDLLFARRSLNLEGAGLCSLVGKLPEPTTFESSIVRVRLDKTQIEPRFAVEFLRTDIGFLLRLPFIRQVAVSGVASMDIAQFIVPCPDPEEQRRILGQLELCEHFQVSHENRLSKLHSLKRGLAHDLLTGRVRVKIEG